MEIAALADATQRLMELLEQAGRMPGAGLKSPAGPSGPPPADVVRAFESALNGDPGPAARFSRSGNVSAAQEAHAAGAAEALPDAPARPHAPRVEHAERRHDAVLSPPPHGEARAAATQAVPRTGDAREVAELIGRLGESMSPETLFRMQYLMGMLRVQGAAGQQITQKTEEAFESLLRQQG